MSKQVEQPAQELRGWKRSDALLTLRIRSVFFEHHGTELFETWVDLSDIPLE